MFMRKRVPRLFGILAAAACLLGVVIATPTAPTANADTPLDPIRAAVNNKRAGSPCGPLNYSIPLEGEAQARVGNHLAGVPPAGQYKGTFVTSWASFEHEQDAINDIIGISGDAINDCKYKDFGVGFARDDAHDLSDVAIALGTPEAPKAADIQCPAGSVTPTVPAGQQCQAAPPVQCPEGSKTSTVPAGQQCEAAPPKQCPPGSVSATVPPDQQCAAPTNTVQMNIEKRGLTNATVTITNSGALGGKCAYNASETGGLGLLPSVSRNVNLDPNGSATITDLLWPPIGSTYHVVLSCNGNYDGKQVEFGHVEQDVSGL
jgi:hypothetical protein